jgi:4-hydroxy-4-methyl-2-oxoglutarate aldolase
MNQLLSPEQLEVLRRFTTPTISNALERLGLHHSLDNQSDGSIRCMFPEFGAIVGYATTATIRSAAPCANPKFPSRKPYWDHVLGYPSPRIAVIEDLDDPPVGAYVGEVNSNIHRALGCIGIITDGCVRDLDEVQALKFPLWARAVAVSHAHCHLEDFEIPVTVGGLRVNPGDLIHADRHGALVIAKELAPRLAAAARAVEDYERPIIQLAKSPDFTTEKLADLLKNEIV